MQRRGESKQPVKARRTNKRNAPKASPARVSTTDTQQVGALKHELEKAREQQTATSELLRIISNSPTELQSVLDKVGKNAARLCEANNAVIFRLEDNVLRQVALYGEIPTTSHPSAGLPVNRDTVSGRAVCDRRTIHVYDLAAEDNDYPVGSRHAKRDGHRTTLATALLRDGVPIGAILIRRMEVRPFSDEQIELLETFAAHAVIAIENARLLSELRQRTDDLSESLEQQMATSEVLRIISSSPGDLEPVFEAMLQNSVRICEAGFGQMFLCEDDNVRLVAAVGVPTVLVEFDKRRGPFQPSPGGGLDGVMRTKQVVHIADLLSEHASYPPTRLGGARSYIAVPMLKENKLVGAIAIYRQEVQPFTDKQIELVKNFAAQAVIAIENARLLSELRESLQRQTATADVLKVISSSPGDLQPVFDAILQNAVRLCGARFGTFWLPEGDRDCYRSVAVHGLPPALAEARQHEPVQPFGSATGLGRAIVTKQAVHVHDMSKDEAYLARNPRAVMLVELGGARTVIFSPMLKDGTAVGVLTICRDEVKPFAEKQIELVQNFAAQAVIAIENARLLSELRQREQDLTEKSTTLAALSSKLAKYLAPQVYDSIFTGQQDVKIVSARKKLTVCFSDLVGFTEITDQMESEDLTQLLNQYLTEMSKIALQYGATIDKYVGDAIVMFFGDPTTLGVKQDALACVQMAIAMQQRVGELAQEWRGIGIGTPLRCRIGIHTGYCTVGNFGSEDRMDYTMVGGTVNLASRLEHEAPPGGILISFETYAHVQDEVHCEERGQVQVKGIAYPVATYAVLGPKQDAERDVTARLRLDLDPERMTDDERRAAADELRRALGLLEKTGKPNG